MSLNIETDLVKVLEKIESKIDRLDQKVEEKIDKLSAEVVDIRVDIVKLDGKISTLEEKLDGKISTLDEKVDGLSKRLDDQAFVNRGVLIGLIVALAKLTEGIAGDAAKLFGFVGNP